MNNELLKLRDGMSNQRSSLDNLEKDVNEKLEIVFDKDQKSLARLCDELTKIEQRIETAGVGIQHEVKLLENKVDSLNKSIEIFDKDISKINKINEIYLRVESEQKRLSDKMEDINEMHGNVQAMNTNIDKIDQKTHLCLKEKTETLQTCLNLDNIVNIIGRQVLQLHDKSDFMSAHYTNLEKQIEDLGRNTSETCVQIDTTTSQVTRLQENITSLTQTAATVNITIMNLEIKAAEYDKLEEIIKRVTEEKGDLNSSVVKMRSVVQGMEENITTMNESLRNESTKLDDLMNLTVNVSQKQNEIEKMKPQLSTIKKSVLQTRKKLTHYISTMERRKKDVPNIESINNGLLALSTTIDKSKYGK
jgi:chromosome segregation ATPase